MGEDLEVLYLQYPGPRLLMDVARPWVAPTCVLGGGFGQKKKRERERESERERERDI